MLEGKHAFRPAAPNPAAAWYGCCPMAYLPSHLHLQAWSINPFAIRTYATPGDFSTSWASPALAHHAWPIPIPLLTCTSVLASPLPSSFTRPLAIFRALLRRPRPLALELALPCSQALYNPHLRDPYTFFLPILFLVSCPHRRHQACATSESPPQYFNSSTFQPSLSTFIYNRNTRSQRPTTMPGECYNRPFSESERA